jgi:viroplasmin and RNaseH domain-containing protein
MVKQEKYYAVARGRVTGIYRKPYDSHRQTDGFSNFLCRAFKCRSDAVQFLREKCLSGPGVTLAVNTDDNDIIDLTSDDSIMMKTL